MFAAEKKCTVHSGDDEKPGKEDQALEHRHRNTKSQELHEGDGCTPVFCVLDDDDVACSTGTVRFPSMLLPPRSGHGV